MNLDDDQELFPMLEGAYVGAPLRKHRREVASSAFHFLTFEMIKKICSGGVGSTGSVLGDSTNTGKNTEKNTTKTSSDDDNKNKKTKTKNKNKTDDKHNQDTKKGGNVGVVGSRKVKSVDAVAEMGGIGAMVGRRLAERYTASLSRLTEQLDIIKFICKDFWIEVFHKQADKLQTNYLGIYVVHDYKFPWLTRLSHSKEELYHAELVLAMATGIIRGALENLGMKAKVTCEIINVPRCQFTIVDATTLPFKAGGGVVASKPAGAAGKQLSGGAGGLGPKK
eukprot:CAMPEP_0197518906 /NCGR_PEP_ID=MMETSP1318-20131121/4161_1 /TAXON_ID=552666 /ORGANISM="Partenskyella glossopodia, Strain RCC365" /LENGTH=279 /DNA_ID=CAMNT_0043069595 /DNA_START=74 /DNA_END=913 /DNA_ORIENTATION=+